MSALYESALERPYTRENPAISAREHSSTLAIFLVCTDLALFSISLYAAYAVVFHRWDPFDGNAGVLVSSLIVIAVWLACFYRVGLYRRSLALSPRDEFYYVVAALCIGILPQVTLFTVFPQISTSRLQLLLGGAISIAAVGGFRALMRATQTALEHARPRRIAIVGSGPRIEAVRQSINIIEGTKILCLDVDDIDATVDPFELAKDRDFNSLPWFQEARRWQCDSLLLTEMLPPPIMPRLLEVAHQHNIKVAFAPPRVQCHAFRLSLQIDGQQALIVPSRLRACVPSALLTKRLFDVWFASMAILLTIPAMLVAAIAIWIESGGPILYRQARIGRDGRRFDLLKFRSMRSDAEASTGPVWAKAADERVTRVGAFLRRFSLDELPQFFNVLRGDMSIVGPRPERPVFTEQFRAALPRYDERHLVRPGITGWSQVYLKRILEPSDVALKLSYDLFYIEQWSLFLDVSVIFKTATEFVFHKAA